MDEVEDNKELTVKFDQLFINRFNNYPVSDQKKIADFAHHINISGFAGLPGRNKSFYDVDTNDHLFIEKINFAKENNLDSTHKCNSFLTELKGFN